MVISDHQGSKINIHDLCRMDFRLLKKYTIICDTKKHISLEYWIFKKWIFCNIFNPKILPLYGNQKSTLEFPDYHEQLPSKKKNLIFFSDFQ